MPMIFQNETTKIQTAGDSHMVHNWWGRCPDPLNTCIYEKRARGRTLSSIFGKNIGVFLASFTFSLLTQYTTLLSIWEGAAAQSSILTCFYLFIILLMYITGPGPPYLYNLSC
jgi:hypothetical protein